jgi:hypothetical protein
MFTSILASQTRPLPGKVRPALMIVARFPRDFYTTIAILVTDVIKAAFIRFSLVRCECGGARLLCDFHDS